MAIVGIAALYPGASGTDQYWEMLNRKCSVGAGARTLDDLHIDVARFGIPPAQAGALARMQILMLEAARQCLSDAGHPLRALPTDRTDVITGTCFGLDRQHANALRIEASRYAHDIELAAVARGVDEAAAQAAAQELRSLAARQGGASPHDRVGEMASTIPARIATTFRFHGRTLAVESADATSFVAIDHAMHNLRREVSDAVLVVAGQRWESPFVTRAMQAKGLLDPMSPGTTGHESHRVGEGVGALLLKRFSSAVRDSDRIYAVILDSSVRHDSRPGAFRYSRSAELRRSLAQASLRAAGVSAEAVTYVECVGSTVTAEAELEMLTALHGGAAPASVAVGSVRDRLGNTFANAGVAAVTKVALALHHRRIPPQRVLCGADESDILGTPLRLAPRSEEWRASGDATPRLAVVHGASFTGTVCHLVIQEHGESGVDDVDEPNGSVHRRAWSTPGRIGDTAGRAAAMPVPVPWPEPIAVVGVAGRFAGAPDAKSFWQVVSSGETRIGPVPESVLDRDLYFAPGALSLTHSYTDQGGHVPVPQEPPADVRIIPSRHAAMDETQRLALTVAAELFQGRAAHAGGDPGARGTAGPLAGRGLVAIGTNLGLTRERRTNAELSLQSWDEAVGRLAALDGLSSMQKKALLASVREARPGAQVDAMSPALLDGCLASGVAALLAHEYRLDAVPLGVEAACASSLAALDICVGALRQGTADFAVTGGVELACNTRDMVLCSALGLLSHSKNAPFDQAADGFSPGDGCGLFLLKRFSDAHRDGDDIVGLIRGIGASNDAKSLIAPNVDGQLLAMRRAFAEVDFGPSAVDYLEAHGTGTKVGDRVEIAAAARMYGSEPRARRLEIGSAKSFFGHTFAAAGSAGLLRTLLAMRAETLPSNANLRTLNPALELDAIPAAVSAEPSPWSRQPGQPRRAAVSSFGTGGINYHVLIEEHLDGVR
ncbi:polyketide synthase [Streptomyces sp. NPDC019531]|uniref:beta-ketoacyl [acyl carrier protein] synthase domain-containing protein n=1 Tax=Streptomyces sp. NPDC019531 TaxID=3365062 RepID=UPI003850658C